MWIINRPFSSPFQITFKNERWRGIGGVDSWSKEEADLNKKVGCWLVVPAPTPTAPVPAKTRGEVVAEKVVNEKDAGFVQIIGPLGEWDVHVQGRYVNRDYLSAIRHILASHIDAELSSVHAKYADAMGKLEKVAEML